MKKIFFIFALFFIAPFVTHAETVSNSYTEVYSDTTIENLNWSVPSINGTYKDLLDTVYEYYKSSSDRVIIVSPKESNFFQVSFFGIDSNLQVTFDDHNGYPYYITNLSATTYKYCSFSKFFDNTFSLENALTTCDKKTKNNVSANQKLVLLNAGGLPAVPYASNFASAQFKEVDKRYAISYKGQTYVPYDTMDFRSLMYRSYIDPTYSSSLFMPKITFSYVDIGVNDSTELIDKVYVSYTSTVDFSDNNYTFYLKRPEQNDFTKIVGSGNRGAVTVSKNGTLIVKVVRNSDNYTSNFTLNLDAIGKPKDYLDEALGRENNEDDNVINSLISSWKSNVLKAFPIINQISSILDLFKTYNYKNAVCLNSNSTGFVHTSSSGEYCVPEFKINFNFIGFKEDFQVINYDFYSKYRDLIFTYIKIFVGVLTFFKVVKILERLFG